MGPGAQTHGGRRGGVQLFRSLGASDTEINEFARWRSDKTIKEYSSTSAARFFGLYEDAAKAVHDGSLSLPPSSATGLTPISPEETASSQQGSQTQGPNAPLESTHEHRSSGAGLTQPKDQPRMC